ncbi:hypothetical protein LguiA_026523 [Lonicera macranthoides]
MEAAGLAISAGSLLLDYKTLRDQAESPNGLDTHLTLGEAIRMLCALRDDRERKYCEFRETMDRTNTYSSWLEMVNNLEEKAKQLIKEHAERKQRTVVLRNPFSVLPNKMKGETFKALELYMQVIDVMLVERPPERVVKMYSPNIEEYETLKGPLNSILHHLKEDRSSGVRLYGKFGVGKTAIMKNLNNHADIATWFESVIWVKASDDYSDHFSTRKMQEDIAKRLKINMEGRDNFKDRIGNKLRGKKYLLLFDGVKEDLNLEEIGIHPLNESGSKIVLTCREKNVCPLLVSHSVEIKQLSYPEAKKMFQTFLGKSRNYRVMREVIEYCCGLPYLIEKIAGAFFNLYTEEEWEIALRNLKYFPQRGDRAIKKVYKQIEFFCNQLEETPKRDCFVHSALYPGESDINTNCLLDCWTAEALCDSRMDARQILQELKTRSYLKEGARGPPGEYVRMEKYLWNVAYHKLLADDQRRNLVKTGELLQHLPPAEDWNHKHRISLADCNLRGLPECPDSPMLFTLFLQNNRSLNRIDTNFFEKMGDLLVLNLQNTGIASLPSSLRQLKKLKVFYLNDCTSLLQLPLEIGELSNLEVLDIRGTGIDKARDPSLQKVIFREPNLGPWAPFPNIGCLRCLKRLSVSFQNFDNENFSQEVLCFCEAISEISDTLEELLIDVNTYRILCNSVINVVRDSVATMTRLTSLKFLFKKGIKENEVVEVIKVVADKKSYYFPEAADVMSSLDLNAASFEVYMGCSISPHRTPELRKYQKYVKICNMQGSSGPTPQISRLLSGFNAIEVVDDGDLEHLSQFEADNLVGVQGCLIEGCKKIEAIADGDLKILDSPMLPNLLELYMKKLPLLRSIWKGPWKAGSLVKLKTLLIEDCTEIEELLADSGISSKLRNLRKLILTNLEKLRRICEIQDSKWLSLEELCIYGCPHVTELPFENQNAMRLKKLILVNLPILTNWANVVTWLALEELQMCGCDEISMLSLDTDSTRNLRKLILYDLPSLTALSTDASLAWPALEVLKIRGCPRLTKLPFGCLDSAPKLKFIKASQKWWEEQRWHPMVKRQFDRFFHPL